MQMRAPRSMYLEPSRTLKKEPITLMSNSWRNCATVVSKNGVVLMMPAAVTSASRPPHASPASRNARMTEVSSATSTSMATSLRAAVARAPATLRSRHATRQPSACKALGGGGADAAGRAGHGHARLAAPLLGVGGAAHRCALGSLRCARRITRRLRRTRTDPSRRARASRACAAAAPRARRPSTRTTP